MHKYLTLLLSILLAILSGCAGNTQQPAVNAPSNPVINNAARTASSIEQPRGPAGVSNRIINGRRVALVIGNANYTDPAWPRLRNAVNDANDIAQDLQRFGFEVLKGLDLNKQQMSEKIAAFGRKAGNAEVALFYYAGHGVQIKNRNYLIPMGVSNLSPSYVEAESINLSFPLNEMDDANSKIKIAILDACRTSVPGSAFRGGLSRSGVKDGFAAPDAMVAGTVIVYASAPGKAAADGTGRNGLFTEGLRVALAQKKANLSLDEVLTTASRWVEQKSAGRQTPYVNGPQTLKADFYLAGSAAAEAQQVELERQRVEAAKIAKPDPRIAELEARLARERQQREQEAARRRAAEEKVRQAQAAKLAAERRAEAARKAAAVQQPTLRSKPVPRPVTVTRNHLDTVTSLNNQADLYRTQSQYIKAEILYKRALAIREQVLGPNHPDTADSLDNLAELYRTQSQYIKAEILYKRALAIREQVLGPNHPNTADSLDNLAELYRTQSQYIKAEILYKRALAIREQVLGPNHPNTADSLDNLAELYRTQSQYIKAEPLYKRALAIREQALGPNHPNTADSLNKLARLYDAQGQYAKAKPLYKKALSITAP